MNIFTFVVFILATLFASSDINVAEMAYALPAAVNYAQCGSSRRTAGYGNDDGAYNEVAAAPRRHRALSYEHPPATAPLQLTSS